MSRADIRSKLKGGTVIKLAALALLAFACSGGVVLDPLYDGRYQLQMATYVPPVEARTQVQSLSGVWQYHTQSSHQDGRSTVQSSGSQLISLFENGRYSAGRTWMSSRYGSWYCHQGVLFFAPDASSAVYGYAYALNPDGMGLTWGPITLNRPTGPTPVIPAPPPAPQPQVVVEQPAQPQPAPQPQVVVVEQPAQPQPAPQPHQIIVGEQPAQPHPVPTYQPAPSIQLVHESLQGQWSRRIHHPTQRGKFARETIHLTANTFLIEDTAGTHIGGAAYIENNKLILVLEEKKIPHTYFVSKSRDSLTLNGQRYEAGLISVPQAPDFPEPVAPVQPAPPQVIIVEQPAPPQVIVVEQPAPARQAVAPLLIGVWSRRVKHPTHRNQFARETITLSENACEFIDGAGIKRTGAAYLDNNQLVLDFNGEQVRYRYQLNKDNTEVHLNEIGRAHV
mgnify:CR=1 FL=1